MSATRIRLNKIIRENDYYNDHLHIVQGIHQNTDNLKIVAKDNLQVNPELSEVIILGLSEIDDEIKNADNNDNNENMKTIEYMRTFSRKALQLIEE